MMTSVQENSGKENNYSEEKWETCTFNVIRTQLKIAKALRNREFRCSFFQTGKTRELLPPASVVVKVCFQSCCLYVHGGSLYRAPAHPRHVQTCSTWISLYSPPPRPAPGHVQTCSTSHCTGNLTITQTNNKSF